MATIIRYVNTAAAGGGDGTTNGTGAGGVNAFASLSAAEAALRQDLTGVTCDVADEQGNNYIALDILCTGTSSDTTAVVFGDAAWVTDATHRLRVRLNGTGAGAKWDTSLYRLVAAGSETGTIQVNRAIHLTLQDLQVESTEGLATGPQALRCNNFAYDVRVVRGFYRCTSTTGTPANARVIYDASTTTSTLMLQNVTIVGADCQGLYTNYNSSAFTFRAYNCTIVNRSGTAREGFYLNNEAASDARVKNLLIQGTGSVNYTAGSTDEAVTILTSDATSPTVGLRSLTATFVDATNWDYHLAAASEGIDDGTDLSADSYYAFSTDGDGATRSGTWDVGADEYVATGTSLYLINSAAGSYGTLQVGGSAPSTATTGTGWTVDTVAASNYARMAYGVERASTNFGGTAQPSSGPDNTLGDCFRTSTAISGSFATGAWTIAIPVIAVSSAGGQDGRVRVRLWKSSNSDGSSATELTAGAVTGTTVTDLGTGAEQVSTATTGSITGFSLTNEYLFLQVAWEITGAAI